MKRQEFIQRWDEAERRQRSRVFWTFYLCGMITLFFVIAGAIVFISAAPFLETFRGIPQVRVALQVKALWFIGFGLAGIGGIFLAEYFFVKRRATILGMRCPNCLHFLNHHIGTYTLPPVPERCTVCIVDGPCRKVRETGLCDKCGHRIYSEDA